MPLHHFDRILGEEYFSYKYAARVMVIFWLHSTVVVPFQPEAAF